MRRTVTSSLSALFGGAPILAAGVVAASFGLQPLSVQAQETVAEKHPLWEAIDEILDDERFLDAHWGAYVQSLETGEIWYERNADRLFLPASNQKIPTTAAALLTLGPDFKFETHLTHSGSVEDGTLYGNLIVFGQGDPTLYERFHEDSRDVFRSWAQELKEKGIERIAGDIIGDDNAFDDQHIGFGWTLSGLPNWWSAEFGALNINENYVDVMIYPPDSVDGEVRLVPNMESDYYTIINEVEVVEEGNNSISLSRPVYSNEITIGGTVVAGSSPFERTPSITNPTLYYVTVLKEVLVEEGIAVHGQPVDCDDLPMWDYEHTDFAHILTHESPELSEILTILMKRSQNMYAEVMVHKLGWYRDGKGTFNGGREVVREALEPFGLDPRSYRFMDGSGLTRYNYIAPRQLAKILIGMAEGEHGELWREMQPIAGVDGTLRNRMGDTAAEGNARAKTGTISNTRGLSGYVTTADGEELVFSLLVNGHITTAAATNDVTDAIVVKLAEYTSD